MALYYWLYYK